MQIFPVHVLERFIWECIREKSIMTTKTFRIPVWVIFMDGEPHISREDIFLLLKSPSFISNNIKFLIQIIDLEPPFLTKYVDSFSAELRYCGITWGS